jgi:hypothetical protein
MAMRVEWLNDDRTILCFTVRDGLNWQEAHRLLEEWVRPMLATTKKSIAFIADFHNSKLFNADADLLIRRMTQLLCDSVHTRALVVVGSNASYPNTSIISADSLADAVERLTRLLAEKSIT